MAITVIRLGSPRTVNQGVRRGAVRRPPRGVPKAQFARRGFYAVWLPNLPPSADLVAFEFPRQTARDLNVGWDGGVSVQPGNKTVFRVAPPSAHGVLFRQKNRFQKRLPITLLEGRTRLYGMPFNYG